MKVIIDTCSLLSLVRYYLPFDNEKILYDFIDLKISKGEIIILDKVLDECRYVAKGIIVKSLEYIDSKDLIIKTIDLLPNKRFFNLLDNNFINGAVRNTLSDLEFENRKNAFLESADAKLLLYCMQNRENDIIIVSEETDSENDNKAFKKLPAICKNLDLSFMTLPQLLKNNKEIDLEFNLK
ncbi:MAG: DUF4411 family protein [Chlorobiales bacterium]|nr:DUF4411 family protein [Chlorobiales bacterium]